MYECIYICALYIHMQMSTCEVLPFVCHNVVLAILEPE